MTQAAVESVAPVRLWCLGEDCTYPTDIAAARAQETDYNSRYAATNPYHAYLVIVSCNGGGLCLYHFVNDLWTTADGPLYLRSILGCPIPTVNPTIPYTYKYASGMCEREVPCLAPNAINPATGQCEPPVDCPVTVLTEPPFNDACATVLENIHSTQAQKDAACGTLTQALKDGKACLEDKLSRTPNAANPIPLKVTSDIRSVAYQAHLRDIWDKMEKLVALENDPVKRSACAARRAEIAAEKGCNKAGPCKSEPNEVCYPESSTQRSHCLVFRPANPSPNDAQHAQGNALDVSLDYTINPLQDVLDARNPPRTIQQFLDDPNPKDCKLIWGGEFKKKKDPVHFYAR